MADKIEKNQGKQSFISALLGAVNSPTNILTEYLNCFRGRKKFKAYILSWLDGEIYKKLLQGKPPWVYVVCSQLADRFGCCRDTVQRHLGELCKMGLLKRLPYKRWATDHIWQYTINVDALLAHQFSTFTSAIFKSASLGNLWIQLLSYSENQVSRNSDSREPEFPLPTDEIQATYTNPLPNSFSTQQQTVDVEVEEGVEESDGPSDEEIGSVCTEIRALSPEFKINQQVRSAIRLNWANVAPVLKFLSEAVRTWKVRSDFNWTGLLVKRLKQGIELDPSPPPREYPQPSLEQLNILGSLGELIYTRLNEPGYPSVLAIEIEGRALVWWEALAQMGGEV